MRIQRWWLQGAAAYRAILANASSLVGATAVTSALGFVYWGVAARQFAPATVGFGSALIAAMSLLGTLSMMGLGTLLLGELPRRPHAAASLVATAVVVTAVVGSTLGAAFACLAAWLSPDFRPLGQSAASVALFALGVALTAITLVLDQALVGMMRGGVQLWRNFVFAAVKLIALFAFAVSAARVFDLTIYLTWVLGNLLSLAMVGGVFLMRGGSLRHLRPDWTLFRSLGQTALAHHGLNLALQFANLALPLVVTVTLSTTANAYFYTAWMIAGFVFTLPFALTVVLYAVGNADPTALARKTRFTLGLAGLAGLIANAVMFVASGFVLQFFGEAYATEANGPLHVLTLGVFALIIKDHFVAVRRIQGRVLTATVIIAAGSCLELTGAAVGASLGGLMGLTLGWLLAVCAEAVWMAPPVLHVAAPMGLRHWRLPDGKRTDEGAEPLASPVVVGASVPASSPLRHR